MNDKNAVCLYANFCRVTGTPEELILDFGLNAQPFGMPTEPVEVKQRIVDQLLHGQADAAGPAHVGPAARAGLRRAGDRRAEARRRRRRTAVAQLSLSRIAGSSRSAPDGIARPAIGDRSSDSLERSTLRVSHRAPDRQR